MRRRKIMSAKYNEYLNNYIRRYFRKKIKEAFDNEQTSSGGGIEIK